MSNINTIRVDGINYTLQGSSNNLYIHSKEDITHNFIGTGVCGYSLLTSDISEGDIFTVNNTPVEAFLGAEPADKSMNGLPWNGKYINFIYDGDNKKIYFSGGNQLTIEDKKLLIPTNLRNNITISGVTGALTWKDLFPETFIVQNLNVIDDFVGGDITSSVYSIVVNSNGIKCSTYDVEQGFRFNTPIDSSVFKTVRFTWKNMSGYRSGSYAKFGVGNNDGIKGDSSFISSKSYTYDAGMPSSGTVDVDIPNLGDVYIKSILAGADYVITKTELLKRD